MKTYLKTQDDIFRYIMMTIFTIYLLIDDEKQTETCLVTSSTLGKSGLSPHRLSCYGKYYRTDVSSIEQLPTT